MRDGTNGLPETERWHRLFADLEAQVGAQDVAEFEAEVAERARIEFGRLRLVDRLRAAPGQRVRLGCLGAGVLAGRLDRLGAGWMLLTDEVRCQLLVPLAAVTWLTGVGPMSSAQGADVVESRLDLRHALRGLARDRAPVRLVLADGEAVEGTIDRVGADYLELAEHAADAVRRAPEVRRMRMVPLAAVSMVRSR